MSGKSVIVSDRNAEYNDFTDDEGVSDCNHEHPAGIGCDIDVTVRGSEVDARTLYSSSILVVCRAEPDNATYSNHATRGVNHAALQVFNT